MRVFVTGATGFIGTAVVQELLAAGHQVTGLTRSREGAQKLAGMGAQAIVGQLHDGELLRQGAARSDGVIHLAFMHGLSHMSLRTRLRLFAGAFSGGMMASFIRMLIQTETGAIDALGSALAGSDRPLVVASAVLFLPFGRTATETDTHVKDRPNRSFSEAAALALVGQRVAASAVRLAPMVHGAADHHGLIPQIIASARKRGKAAYVGDGTNRWPAVHRFDAASLFRLALEKADAGAIYHGVAESGFPFREIAGKIGSALQLPVASCDEREAARHFGFLSAFVGLDNPASSEQTQRVLGWRPQHPGLFADLERAGYF